jgi:hypothetical protein
MRALLLSALLAVAPVAMIDAQTIPDADRTRLVEAFRLAQVIGDSVWHGWHAAPFAVLLLTPQGEFLLNHPKPTPEFRRIGHDSLLASDVYVRRPSLPPHLLATFPAVGGVNTIVVGDAATTSRRSTQWVLTVLHEHFHQLQMSHPGYQSRIRRLDLARGDETGQWMLNFPFPYRTPLVRRRFAAFSTALIAAATTPAPFVADRARREVVGTREAMKAALTPADYRYLTFQMWQEGVARYIELRAARLASRLVTPSDAMRALPDFTSYSAEADALEHEIRIATTVSPLAAAERVAFYPVGAAYAMLLDRVRPSWPDRYFAVQLSLDGLLPTWPSASSKAERR